MIMYQHEENIIAQAKQILSDKKINQEELWQAYQELLNGYEAMLHEIKILSRINDRQLNKNVDRNQAEEQA
ncbi:MAG: hypothetical protein ACFCUI_10555 [Bernardetiaceae bacterium]